MVNEFCRRNSFKEIKVLSFAIMTTLILFVLFCFEISNYFNFISVFFWGYRIDPSQWGLSEGGWPRSWAGIQSIQNTMGQNRIERNHTLLQASCGHLWHRASFTSLAPNFNFISPVIHFEFHNSHACQLKCISWKFKE